MPARGWQISPIRQGPIQRNVSVMPPVGVASSMESILRSRLEMPRLYLVGVVGIRELHWSPATLISE